MSRVLATVLAAALVCASASAAEVFVTRDSQGRPVYTDRPESLPAQKLSVASQPTDAAEVQARHQADMAKQQEADKTSAAAAKKAAEQRQAKELSAADQAKRCQDARAHYQGLMNARRIYEPGSTPDERRYLDSAEMDASRENAKRVMDEFCTSP
jgi:hypothetical protein